MVKYRFSLWQLFAYVAACAVAVLLNPELLLWLLSVIPATATFLLLRPRSIQHRSRWVDLTHLFLWALLPMLVLNVSYLALAMLVDAIGMLR